MLAEFFWVKIAFCALFALTGLVIALLGGYLVFRELVSPGTKPNSLHVGGKLKLETSSVGTICIALGLLSMLFAVRSLPTKYALTEKSLEVAQMGDKARLTVSLPAGKTLANISDAELATAISSVDVRWTNDFTAAALSMPLTGVAIRNEGNGTYRLFNDGQLMAGAAVLIADPSEQRTGTAAFFVQPRFMFRHRLKNSLPTGNAIEH